MPTKTTPLAEWLDSQIGEGKAFESNRDLARVSGLSDTTIRRLRDGAEPGIPTLRKLESVSKIALDDLERMAGILPGDPDITPDEAKRQLRIKQLLNVISRLPEEDQAEIAAMAVTMAGLSNKNRALLLSMAKTMLEQEVA